MLQHDDIHPVDCVYMDVQRDTVHLQVPLGEFCEMCIQIWISCHKGCFLWWMFICIFQICPYNAIKFLPRERHITGDTSRKLKQLLGKEVTQSGKTLFSWLNSIQKCGMSSSSMHFCFLGGDYKRQPSSIPQNELLWWNKVYQSCLSGLNVNQQQAVLSYLVYEAKGPL